MTPGEFESILRYQAVTERTVDRWEEAAGDQRWVGDDSILTGDDMLTGVTVGSRDFY
jgi:hypothetical protein